MEIKSKYPQKLIDKAHDLAFQGELSNKAIAKKLEAMDTIHHSNICTLTTTSYS